MCFPEPTGNPFDQVEPALARESCEEGIGGSATSCCSLICDDTQDSQRSMPSARLQRAIVKVERYY
jgi:hypothetical protein